MRKVLRDVDTHTYWEKRWGAYEADASEFRNLDIYPVKYVDPIMTKGSKTLEAGCGLGRVVKHYHKLGFDIVGCDYSKVAVEKLNSSNPELRIREADITKLPYGDAEFDNVLALGVFHGIEDLAAIDRGIDECLRCLKPNGHFVASVRADTLENWLIDWITEQRGSRGTQFHKWCFAKDEFQRVIMRHGAKVDRAELITNVPFLSKFSVLRKQKNFDEGAARSNGFELNLIGSALYASLKFVRPNSFGTTLVFTATK